MKTLSVKLPESVVRRLDAAARRRGVSRSRLVRESIERALESGPAATDHSVLDLVSDLVGCAEGPPDLSTNRRHLKGYGR